MKKLLGMGLVTAGAIASGLLTDVQVADAFVVHEGWNYTMDSYRDSTPVKTNGTGLFEIRGMAHKVIDNSVIVAINSSVDLDGGVDWDAAKDDKVHFGDLMINFTGKSLDQATGELYGIRFAANNDSTISDIGVYSNVTARSVTSLNSGWSTLEAYNNNVLSKGITPTHGELAYDDEYFDVTQNPVNSIDTGTRIGDIEMISDLSNLGLGFEHFGNAGAETIAFSFDLGLFDSEDVNAMFHFAMECNNDIVAGRMNFAPNNPAEVPTPAAILPAILGMFGAASRKTRKIVEEV